MDLYERELRDAVERLRALGRDDKSFSFEMAHQPPDPDGAGMFTATYEVKIVNRDNAKSLTAVGGIGLRWVDYFEQALKAGHFD